MATNVPPYTNVSRPRMTIKTIDGADTLYTFDAFESNNDISVAYLDMENAVGENGTFNAWINDHNNQIPKDNIHNVKVFLEMGKTQAAYEHFMIGYGDIFTTDRPGTNAQYYQLTGYGSRVWAYQLFIHRREKYKTDESDAKVYNQVDNALTKRLWRPLKTGDESISDITGWSRDGISNKVNIVNTIVDKAFVYFGDFLDELCDITGAVWFVDYSTGSEIFTLSYNTDLHTPIILKSGDLADRNNDNPDTTAYISSPFRVEDNTTTEGGAATRLITTTIQDKIKIYEQDSRPGATTTTFRAIAQQVVIDNDARRIESIELGLSKVGDPDSPKSRLNGDIVLDNGSNKPSNQVIDEFHISLSSIEENFSFVEVPVEISDKDLDVAQAKIWIRIFQRSNEEDVDGNPDGNGNPNQGTEHTIKWHHNNIFNTNQTLYSATANEGDEDKKDTLSWANATNLGPLYTLRVNSNIRRLFARTNKAAANRIRLREAFIITDFLSEPQDVTRYLSLNLSQTSKGRRGIADFRSTIPTNFLFRPYQWVGFSDGKSQIEDLLQVQRVGYVCGTNPGDPQIGTHHVNLTLSGLYNTLVGACTCV